MRVLKSFEKHHFHEEFTKKEREENQQKPKIKIALSVPISPRRAGQAPNEENENYQNAQQTFRSRIKKYGKWYIDPMEFNRKFELIRK